MKNPFFLQIDQHDNMRICRQQKNDLKCQDVHEISDFLKFLDKDL